TLGVPCCILVEHWCHTSNVGNLDKAIISEMSLTSRILVLGFLAAASGQQQGGHFTKEGKPCVAYEGTPAVCGHHRYNLPICYTGYSEREWALCSESHASDYRCSSDGVTRDGDCDATSDNYCCSPAGWCGSTVDHCNCDNCKDLRYEACTNKDCGEGNCYWNNARKISACRCRNNSHKDPSTGRCHECVSHGHCPDNEGCRENICEDPCNSFCNPTNNATCNVTNHRPLCSCPSGFTLVGQTDCESGGGIRNRIVDWAVIGGATAGLVIILIIICATTYICRKSKREKQ
ncbi:unnamed protein product, partial [Meganyctiphanes norvegica]